MITCTPFQVFDLCNASFNDLESEELVGKPLDLVSFSLDENINDLLRIEMNKWDMSCYYFDGDLIYDIDDDSIVKST
jgi:hypothetical protein